MTDDDLDQFDSDEANRIVREVTLGQRPARPDEPWQRRFRARVRAEIRELEREAKAKGLDFEVDVPHEIPSMEDTET